MENNLNLELARLDQANEIVSLVNSAYRGEAGWTTERNIIDGNRITRTEIERLITNQDSHLLVAIDSRVFACICVKQQEDKAHIGLFAVDPQLQGKGLGKRVLNLAEQYAAEMFGVDKFVMAVISQRTELIAYYERRGYVKTNQIEDFPIYLNVGNPKINDLMIEYLEKQSN